MGLKSGFFRVWRWHFKLRPLRRRQSSYSCSFSATTFTLHDPSLTIYTHPDMNRPTHDLTTITTDKPFIDARKRENWDDDFDFSNDKYNDINEYRSQGSDAQVPHQATQRPTRQSSTSGAKLQQGNWDGDFIVEENDPGQSNAFSLRPPTSHSAFSHVSILQPSSSKVTENWDDDFLDKDEVEVLASSSVLQPKTRKSISQESEDVEDWDNEIVKDPASKGAARSIQMAEMDLFLTSISRSATPDWCKQLEEVDKVLSLRSGMAGWSVDGSRSELGSLTKSADEEDRTITRRRPRHHSSASPPPMPIRKNGPTSPTASEFSTPHTLRGSIYSGTGLLAYRSTPSVGSHMQGVSLHTPEVHRPRRRLKKKQRPVGMNVLDDSGYNEQQDRIMEGDEQELPPRARSRSRPASPSPEVLQIIPPNSPRSSLRMFTRLGSVKKWRQRASTGPSEVITAEHSHRSSTPNRPRSNSWFTKVNSPDLKKYRSKDHLRVVEEQTPKVRGNRSRSNTTSALPPVPTASANLDFSHGRATPDSRRPFSLQSGRQATFPASEEPMTKNEGVQVTRNSSIRIRDQHPPSASAPPKDDKEGRRGLIGNVRRLSLGGKHKRAKSTTDAAVQYSPPPKETTIISSEKNESTVILTKTRPSEDLIRTRPSTPAPLTNVTNINARPTTPARQLKLQVPNPSSPQPSSLGRYAANNGASTPASLRRCSMGDLKIPSRISQAQDGIKRDLSLVKEFAACVEKLRNFQTQYEQMVREVRDHAAREASSRPGSPIKYHLPRPPSRSSKASSATKLTNNAIRNIELQYRNWWEAADVLINLGGAPPDLPGSNGTSPTENDRLGGAETNFAGATPPSKWKGSTGKHDLNERQLVILSEMLDSPDLVTPGLPEASSTSLARRYPSGSTTTLPSEEQAASPKPSDHGKRKSYRLRGLKSIFRGFTKSRDDSKRHVSNSTAAITSHSSTSEISTTDGHHQQSQFINGNQPNAHFLQPQVDHTTDVRKHPNSPYGTGLSTDLPSKSPRRPSLATIFRVGQKVKPEVPKGTRVNPIDYDDDADLEWDRLGNDSPALGKRHRIDELRTPKKMPSNTPVRRQRSATTHAMQGSQVSLHSVNQRITSEQLPEHYRKQKSRSSLKHDFSASGSVRSVPPGAFTLPSGDLRLVVTPENIPPLLSYALKVSIELDKCLAEVRHLMHLAISS